MPIYSNFYQTLTTACPIVELRGYAAACGLKGHLYAYLEFNGPTGTARDGLAEGMLALAIEKKQLAPGQPIIEAASGPFATALTLASLTAGHPIVLVMPEDAPALRQEYLLRLGAQIRHSPARSGLAGARALAAQTAAANGWYYMNWLANDDNPEYLYVEKFAALITEAEKSLGYPYVWGGSNPDTSFACSCFVSYVLTNCGRVITGLLCAQGLYNVCTPVSKANAQPGDLIFFVGTYDTPGVSHVGIYVGDGVMIHCGDPIQYTSINSSYWQQHFYAFGRPAY